GRNKKVIENYIRNQLQEDIVAEQLTLVEYIDPFTGEEIKKKKQTTLLRVAGKVVHLADLLGVLIRAGQ
ncbi:hypothetical protein BUZ15_12885, partial [Staphylococcus gallinarum]